MNCSKCGHAINDTRRRGSDEFNSFCIYGCGCECEFPAAPTDEVVAQHEYVPTQLGGNSPCAWADHPDAIGDADYYCGKPPSDPIHVADEVVAVKPPERIWIDPAAPERMWFAEMYEPLAAYLVAYMPAPTARADDDRVAEIAELVKVYESTGNSAAAHIRYLLAALTAARGQAAAMKVEMIAKVRSYEVHPRDQGLVDAIANDLETVPLPSGPQAKKEDK